MVNRLTACKNEFRLSGVYPKSCLMTNDQVPSPLRNKVDVCVKFSFWKEGDYESPNTILDKDERWAK